MFCNTLLYNMSACQLSGVCAVDLHIKHTSLLQRQNEKKKHIVQANMKQWDIVLSYTVPNLPLTKLGVDCCLDNGVAFLLILYSVADATRSLVKVSPERQK